MDQIKFTRKPRSNPPTCPFKKIEDDEEYNSFAKVTEEEGEDDTIVAVLFCVAATCARNKDKPIRSLDTGIKRVQKTETVSVNHGTSQTKIVVKTIM